MVDFQRFNILLHKSNIQSSEKIINESQQYHSVATEIDQFVAQKNIPSALNKLKELRKFTSFTFAEIFFERYRKLAPYCISRQLHHYVFQNLLQVSSHEWHWDFHWMTEDIRAISVEGDESIIKIWNVTTGKCISILKGHTRPIYSVCFSPNGKLCLSGGEDGTAMIWDIESGKCIRKLEGHSGTIWEVIFNPDGRHCLTTGDGCITKLWDIISGRCMHTEKWRISIGNSPCFSPDGKMVVIGGYNDQISPSQYNNKIKIWDVVKRKNIHTLKGHTDHVHAVCFSPDGRLALSGSEDHLIMLWDVETGKRIHILEGHTSSVFSVCFSSDGRFAVSGSHDKTMKIWEIETGKCIHSFEGFTDGVVKVCFSPDGQQIAVASGNKIYIYDLDFDLHFPGWHDWDEGARPYLEIFLSLHPSWSEDNFNNILILDLQNRGYGWLRPEGVKAELEKMTQNIK